MIQEFVKRFDEKRDDIRAELGNLLDKKGWELEYDDIVRTVLEAVNGSLRTRDLMDLDSIHRIGGDDYQGTMAFVISSGCGFGDDFWYVRIAYGSCSVCDMLQAIIDDYKLDDYKEQALNDLFTLALHVVQRLKKMEGEIVND